MKTLTRRSALKLAALGSAALLPTTVRAEPPARGGETPVWEVFEVKLAGSSAGNPYIEVELSAVFTLGHRTVQVDGFYDGDGVYKIRFMPDTVGNWSYTTASNLAALSGQQGGFRATPPLPGAHGPVRVQHEHHFAYADGTAYFPFGTTCYAWIHQSEALQRETLASLKASPFNKIRMCVFPKHYEYNHNEPEFYPFPRTADGVNDYTRFDPRFFAHLEARIADLRAMNVEADLILFHPYDRWGYQSMPAEVDDRYLRYVLARLSAYRNIWWSLANEYDLMKAKTTQDFDRFFHIVEQRDPYAHLRSVHYSVTMYDYGRPWVTHASLQTIDFDKAPGWLAAWKKPICFDEVQYEGNLNKRWGNVSGAEMARRFWLGVMAGCYVTHGETYLDPDTPLDEAITPTIWWSHGGTLHGTSPKQIAFLRSLVEETGQGRPGLEPQANPYYLNASGMTSDGKRVRTILYYFDFHQPIWYEFPLPEGSFTAEAIDPIAGTITPVPGLHGGKAKLRLSGRPYQGMRFTAAG